ncbi:MAG: SDR family oxidoreductase [Parvibaculum sp.]|nr:SDR family oxidoreductase [Parvibaculum sp.]MDR3498251.1 SDR family oxidoreductase [Parvibaculum sp.]
MAARKSARSAASGRDTVLITGASAGIGAALARQFAAGGFDLVLVARSRDKLETLARELKGEHAVEATVMPADLSTPGAPKALFEAVKKRKLAIDILVNNARVLEMGAFNAISPERHQELIALNVATLTDMTSRFLAPMLERGKGRILNVASIAAFQPVPSLATYAATKAYVLSLTESLSEELKGSGVTVTALCPGITETSMVDRAREANAAASQLPPFMIGDVNDVAAQGYAALMAGEVIRVPGVLNFAASLAARATPKWVVRRFAGALGRMAL